jgi:hypothetical protein
MDVARTARRGVACVVVFLLLVTPVRGQESRAEAIAAEQARKAAALKPYTPSGAERWFTTVRHALLDEPSGVYPYFASVYSGGGFTLGAGYRQYFGDRTHWDLKGLYSLQNYKLVELSTDSWGHAQGRLDLHARLGWRDAPKVAYHGLGIDSPEDGANFRLKQGYVGGDMEVRPGGFTVFTVGLAYEDYTIEEGTGRTPSIEEIFTPETAPGLGVSPAYLHTSASAGLDWRAPGADYARRGGLVRLSYHNYADQDDAYTFDRLDGEIVQHLPILRENWVISLHGLVRTTLDDADQVPFFLMPSLGSGSTLRGYSSWRFRDRHSLLLSGEFRWLPSRFLDMALFYDTGKVASQWDGLSLKELESNVGIGLRLHGPLATPVRIELARGREGINIVFAASAAF